MTLLLKSGTVLIHNDEDNVVPTRADVLLEGDRISKIEATISPPPSCEVIDCTNKIVSPGFVDTHHHGWQSPFKGLFGDMDLLPYSAITHAAGREFTPEDMFWANLSGSLEAIDAGTTANLDHAHMNYDPQTRVQLGFGWDFYFLPKEDIETVFRKVRSLGSKVITSHFIRHLLDGDGNSLVAKFEDYGLLLDDMVFSHAGGATAEDIKLIQEASCLISATPNTEEAMQVGPTVPFRKELPGINQICSLGVDCHSATTSSLLSEMRLVLQMARGRDSEQHIRLGRHPSGLSRKTLEVFNMGKIQGARALRMSQDIGSISVGKKGDLVIFDVLTPGMYRAAHRDPVLAIVLHSNIRDVDTLLPVNATDWKRNGQDFIESDREIRWAEVMERVLDMQRRFVTNMSDYNLSELESAVSTNRGVK
ncbi:uncharacterized protein FOBCDRAFT_238465 [Fusarium oxysporum Fo47]|uniref:uncharacterized protein n=1 Tax=Fusarium oxysporum Fo47 TaxID=660027 RepID=UPI002869CBC7|nr:uncharacterized protein FOBCDRAFT_238465 [Fusarium oxysporum Fo47]QKD52149.2 hypothetical protein FOBCDRAFT_238465 [Fusarium oxysporum Fo47]